MGYYLKATIYLLWRNAFLLFLAAFFAYRTFFLGRLNYALLILLSALCLIIVCRVIAQYSQKATVGLIYRGLVLLSAGLLVLALGIQTLRFVFVFAPGLADDPTLPKILVRIGITTADSYVIALILAFVYYLHAHSMLREIWNGFASRHTWPAPLSRPARYEEWRQIRFSNAVLIRTFFWGGLASIVTLTVGLVAWLLR